MVRKLASIQVVDQLIPIENADKIEIAKILGWQVVVKKGEFNPGDRCVFFEIDSVLPKDAPWADFMESKKYRVKSCKLRGALSQGLALPIDILPENYNAEVEEDVTEVLGVKKYEIPFVVDPNAKNQRQKVKRIANFPPYIPKTDEIRIQSAPRLLDEIKEKSFYISVKCDGTSCTIAKLDGELIVCSRNWKLEKGDKNSYWRVAKKYHMDEVLPEGYAVQGELCGPGIQKNRLGLDDFDLFVFNVFDIKNGKYLDFWSFVDFCKTRELKIVPIERVVQSDEACQFDCSIENFLELAKGTYQGTKNRREGIVIRPLIETHSQVLKGRLSFKVLNNDYLLKDED